MLISPSGNRSSPMPACAGRRPALLIAPISGVVFFPGFLNPLRAYVRKLPYHLNRLTVTRWHPCSRVFLTGRRGSLPLCGDAVGGRSMKSKCARRLTLACVTAYGRASSSTRHTSGATCGRHKTLYASCGERNRLGTGFQKCNRFIAFPRKDRPPHLPAGPPWPAPAG